MLNLNAPEFPTIHFSKLLVLMINGHISRAPVYHAYSQLFFLGSHGRNVDALALYFGEDLTRFQFEQGNLIIFGPI